MLRSAERLVGRPAIPTQDGVDSATLPTDAATFAGEIVKVWPDKDYVFIRGEDGTDWFSHRRDFVSDGDWGRRTKNASCVFLHGEWNGKPRATSVRLHERS